MSDPEEKIAMIGGPSRLHMKFLKLVIEEKLAPQAAIQELAKRLDVEPSVIEDSIRSFMKTMETRTTEMKPMDRPSVGPTITVEEFLSQRNKDPRISILTGRIVP